jgi:hypothetical protein
MGVVCAVGVGFCIHFAEVLRKGACVIHGSACQQARACTSAVDGKLLASHCLSCLSLVEDRYVLCMLPAIMALQACVSSHDSREHTPFEAAIADIEQVRPDYKKKRRG